MEKRRVLLGVSGGVASYKAAELAGLLVNSGIDVDVLMTEDACSYISPLTFHEITSNPVSAGELLLADEPDAVVIAPATKELINNLAEENACDLLTRTVMSAQVQVIIAPAMSYSEYTEDETAENISRLKEKGCIFAEPSGRRVNRDLIGRLAPPKQIADIVRMFVKEKNLAGRRIMIVNRNSSDAFCAALAGEARDSGAYAAVCGVNLPLPLGVKRAESVESMGKKDGDSCVIYVTADRRQELRPNETAVIYEKNASEIILPDGRSFKVASGNAAFLLNRIMEIKNDC